MNSSFYLGIDISKEWLDIALLNVNKPRKISSYKINNNTEGFKKLIKWLRKAKIKDLTKLFVCMEHTGVYSIPICEFFEKKQIKYTLVAGTVIKFSSGITRAKNDKLDARRIAKYIYKHHDEIIIHTLSKKTIRKIKTLLGHIKRLKKVHHAFTVSLKEIKSFENKEVSDTIKESAQLVIEQCQQQIKATKKQIEQYCNENPELKKNYDLLLSVPGIGQMNALYMLVFTKNFVAFKSPRQFATYAGVAPFRQSSGKSFSSKSKVSQKANKKIKALLTNGVVCSYKSCPEYREYFNKQLEKGKNEYSIKNALRNKIIHRAFAVIKRGTPYIDLNKHAA